MTYIITYKLKGLFQDMHRRKCQEFSYTVCDNMYILTFKSLISKDNRKHGKDYTLYLARDVLEGFSVFKI